MTEHEDNKALAAKVVDLMYGEMFTKEIELPTGISEEQAAKIKARRQKFRDSFRENFRDTHIALYTKHMSHEQLQALLDFHDSEMGQSIKEAQKHMYRELQLIQEKQNEEQNRKKPKKGGAVIGTIVRKKDLFYPDDDS